MRNMVMRSGTLAQFKIGLLLWYKTDEGQDQYQAGGNDQCQAGSTKKTPLKK